MTVMEKTADALRVLASNLRALMDQNAGLRTQQAVAKATRGVVNQTTVGRILRGQHTPTLETIAALAKVFDLMAWQVLVPELDPKNPPVLRQPHGAEAEFYRRLQDIAAELGINGKP